MVQYIYTNRRYHSVKNAGLSLKKIPHAWLPCAKTTLTPVMMLWRVKSVKLNIVKRIEGLEIKTLNREKM